MLATLFSAALQGIDAELVYVEVNSGESGDLKLVKKGMTPERVLALLGQPHTRDGSAFTFCTTSGTKTVRFTGAGTVA